jgi:hypothetical protein
LGETRHFYLGTTRGVVSSGAYRTSTARLSGLSALYAFLAGERAAALTGRLFTAAGGYVGLQTGVGDETLLAWRDVAQGPRPVEELAQRIEERLAALGTT